MEPPAAFKGLRRARAKGPGIPLPSALVRLLCIASRRCVSAQFKTVTGSKGPWPLAAEGPDAYAVFKSTLDKGNPPDDWADLMQQIASLVER